MKTRRIPIGNNRVQFITYFKPVTDGATVLYRNKLVSGLGSAHHPDGVLKIGGQWYPVYRVTKSCDSLIEALGLVASTNSLPYIAYVLSNFNLSLADCMKDNRTATIKMITKAAKRSFDASHIDKVWDMATSIKDSHPALFKMINNAANRSR